MARHTHQYTIADDEAVKVMLDKLLASGPHQQRREKLLKALEEASRRYHSTTAKERKGSRWRSKLRREPSAIASAATPLPRTKSVPSAARRSEMLRSCAWWKRPLI